MLPVIRKHCLILPAAFAFWVSAYSSSDPACKSFPGSTDWPSTETWSRLNESLGGRLLRPTPPGAVCHPGQPVYNEDGCADATARWSSYEYHVADPVSVIWNNWSNDTCLPDPTHMCSPDGYSAFVVNATTSDHVKTGVDFGLSLSNKADIQTLTDF